MTPSSHFTNEVTTSVHNLIQIGSLRHLGIGTRNPSWRDYWNPATAIARFVGRQTELQRLGRLLRTSTHVASVQSIGGFGGIGKTALAVAYADLHHSDFDGRVFYDFQSYGVKTPDTADQALVKILPTVAGIEVAAVSRLTEDQRVAAWQSVCAQRRLLMVWDNVAEYDQIRDLMIHADGCETIITSRGDISGEGIPVPLRLDVLTPADAIALFTRIAGTSHNAASVSELVHRDLLIPVLIASHARSIATGTPIDEVIADLPVPGASSRSARFEDLFARLEGSYLRLDQDQAFAFRAFSSHPGRIVTVGSMGSALSCSVGEAESLMMHLERAGLAERPADGPASTDRSLRLYTAHDMIRAFGTDKAHHEPSVVQGIASEFDMVQAELVNHYLGEIAALRAEDHQQFTVQSESIRDTALAGTSEEHGRLALRAGDLSYTLDLFADAKINFQHAVEVFTTSGAQVLQARALIGLGYVARLLGQIEQAQTRFSAALELSTAYGNELERADACRGLGLLARIHGEVPEALEYYGRAITTFKAHNDPRGLGRALQGLAAVARMTGRLDDARHHAQQALDLYRAEGTPAEVADALRGLGACALLKEDASEAERCFRLAAEVYEATGQVGKLANSLQGIARALVMAKRSADARVFCERAIEVHRRIGNIQGLADTHHALGKLKQSERDYKAAEQDFRIALTLYQGSGHKGGLGNALESLGETAKAVGDTTRANQWFTEALAVFESAGMRVRADVVQARIHDTPECNRSKGGDAN
jgi:tetratricopeptide (TPR) repeat protein